MNVLRFFKKKLLKVQSPFGNTFQRQKEYIEAFPEPKNLWERSFFQYKCQRFLDYRLKYTFFNFSSFFLLPFFLLFFYWKRRKESLKERCDAVFINNGLNNIIPKELEDKIGSIVNVSVDNGNYLIKKDISYILKNAPKYFFYPYFILKITYKISLYRNIIDEYEPSIIIVTSEYSFTSSVLTDFCNTMRTEHYNIMHGEKLYFIRDSFFKFSKCIVWDLFYKKLFISLKADSTQFEIVGPVIISNNLGYSSKYKYKLTYYLGGEKQKELTRIKDALLKSKFNKDFICIRPHPRYSNLAEVNRILNCFKIEDQTVPLNQSLQDTEYVVSLYSTVLNQAYFLNKKIIIDNVSNPNEFSSLKDLKYIMLSKTNARLSEFIL